MHITTNVGSARADGIEIKASALAMHPSVTTVNIYICLGYWTVR